LFTGLLGTTAISASPVGNYSFTLGTLSAGGNYMLQLSANPPTFAVTPATLTITPNSGQSMTYGSAVPVLGYTASGFVNGDFLSLFTGLLGTTAISASPVGDYSFTLGTLSAGGNYMLQLSANPPTLAVTPATLTITPNSGQSMPYGSQVPVLGYTASGFVNGDISSSLTGLLGTAATSASPLGNYAFTLGTLAAGANYTLVLPAQPPTFAVTAGPAGAITTDQPTFAWPTAAGAKQYALKITEGKTVVLKLTRIGTTCTLKPAQALTPGQSYTWSLTPLNAKGTAIGPSSKLTFQVLPLGAPTALGPMGSIATDRPTFTWTAVTDASHTRASHFTLTVTDTTTKKQILTITGLTGTSYTLTTGQALTPGHSFTWSVTAVSTNGKAKATSLGAAFTIAALTAPTGLVFTPASNTFSWQAVPDAGHYSLRVIDSPSRKTVIDVADVTGTTYKLTSKEIKALKHGHSYTWFVTAVSTNGKVSVRSTGATSTM
jgi:hypothetical protein